jgi:hypothetical protein
MRVDLIGHDPELVSGGGYLSASVAGLAQVLLDAGADPNERVYIYRGDRMELVAPSLAQAAAGGRLTTLIAGPSGGAVVLPFPDRKRRGAGGGDAA